MTRRAVDPAALFDAARQGDRSALARPCRSIERGGEPARVIGRLAYPLGGQAYTVGITGAPGAGKSTLTSALIGLPPGPGPGGRGPGRRSRPRPSAGGAILGDRVRMQDHATDPGVFIRSMATRGHLGGLALAAPAGRPAARRRRPALVLVETVGVGQVEVEIAGKADTTVVVVNPGWGDSVQANKAGLMEIADVFVINKADRKGVDETRRDIEVMLDLSDLGDWRPPIIPTVAHQNEGAEALWAAVTDHRAYAEESGLLEAATRGAAAPGAGRDRGVPGSTSGPASCARATPTSGSRPTSWPAGSTRGPRPTRC